MPLEVGLASLRHICRREINMKVSLCVCVCVCDREREREGGRGQEREREGGGRRETKTETEEVRQTEMLGRRVGWRLLFKPL